MIKINYGGMTIEVSTTKEALEIMSGKVNKFEKNPVQPNFQLKPKNKKLLKSEWTEEEMKSVFNMLDNSVHLKLIAKDSSLRMRHSKRGIEQMVYKVKNNIVDRKFVSEIVAEAIKKYHDHW